MPDPPATAILILKGDDEPNDDLRDALERWRAGGHAIEIRPTRRKGDATRFARDAVASGVATVIAGGGDGTIHEVVAGFLSGGAGAAPALGLLPLGTANDFAETLGVPEEPDDAVRLALTGETRAVDVGWVGDQPVVNMATGGFGTEVTLATPEGLKERLGRISYLLTGLTKLSDFKAERIAVRTETDRWAGDVVAVAVGNGRRAGGSVRFCPEARIDDGLLDLTLVPGEGEGAIDALGQLLEAGADWFAGALRFRSPWIEIDAPGGLSWNLDGEPFQAERLRFEVRKGALRLRVPERSPLLGWPED
ncbi:MAG TPA: lipid kinase YegS [Longimicrobiales bacterium]|nr:lipid kinase YegS [Longimicrobiales bacterium]